MVYGTLYCDNNYRNQFCSNNCRNHNLDFGKYTWAVLNVNGTHPEDKVKGNVVLRAEMGIYLRTKVSVVLWIWSSASLTLDFLIWQKNIGLGLAFKAYVLLVPPFCSIGVWFADFSALHPEIPASLLLTNFWPTHGLKSDLGPFLAPEALPWASAKSVQVF